MTNISRRNALKKGVTVSFPGRGRRTSPGRNSAPGCGTDIGRTFHAGQQGGLNMMRDMPRYVKLIEKGQFDVKSPSPTARCWRPSSSCRVSGLLGSRQI
jgi:hypothetical protein